MKIKYKPGYTGIGWTKRQVVNTALVVAGVLGAGVGTGYLFGPKVVENIPEAIAKAKAEVSALVEQAPDSIKEYANNVGEIAAVCEEGTIGTGIFDPDYLVDSCSVEKMKMAKPKPPFVADYGALVESIRSAYADDPKTRDKLLQHVQKKYQRFDRIGVLAESDPDKSEGFEPMFSEQPAESLTGSDTEQAKTTKTPSYDLGELLKLGSR